MNIQRVFLLYPNGKVAESTRRDREPFKSGYIEREILDCITNASARGASYGEIEAEYENQDGERQGVEVLKFQIFSVRMKRNKRGILSPC